MNKKPKLTIQKLKEEAKSFADKVSGKPIKDIFGKTDGKNVGTYFERKFKEHLSDKYEVEIGSSASGLDLPKLKVDIKVTSAKGPQSSSSFKNPKEQIYGLEHSLLIFIYQREDDAKKGHSKFFINNVVFVSEGETSDKTLTEKVNSVLKNKNADSLNLLIKIIKEKNKHLSDDLIDTLAEELLGKEKIVEGKIGISNAPQWRLRFSSLVKKEKKPKKMK